MRVLETCPRRYALQYIGLKEKRSDRTNHRALARRRPAEDHMRRAVSGGIARRLTCLRRGERLSPGDEAGWVAETIRAAFKIGGAAGHHRLDTEPVDDLISRAQHRLRRSREIDILRRIDRDEAAEWLPLERLRPLHTTNESLWTAPDLIVSIDGRWQLIRFAMEAGRSQPAEHQRLELGLVLDWAVREPSLPSDPAAFCVASLGDGTVGSIGSDPGLRPGSRRAERCSMRTCPSCDGPTSAWMAFATSTHWRVRPGAASASPADLPRSARSLW